MKSQKEHEQILNPERELKPVEQALQDWDDLIGSMRSIGFQTVGFKFGCLDTENTSPSQSML